VTIVEFSDFQCGFCKMAAETIADIQTEYPQDVAVVFRQFPLPFHKFATAAAVASECAARQGQFEGFRETLFSGQASIGSKPWESYAVEARVQDQRAFQQCLQDPSAEALFKQDRIAGVRLGVEATPTLLINDTKVTGYPGSARLAKLVRLALDSAKEDTTR
jgi:protein-disulfide isomerase